MELGELVDKLSARQQHDLFSTDYYEILKETFIQTLKLTGYKRALIYLNDFLGTTYLSEVTSTVRYEITHGNSFNPRTVTGKKDPIAKMLGTENKVFSIKDDIAAKTSRFPEFKSCDIDPGLYLPSVNFTLALCDGMDDDEHKAVRDDADPRIIEASKILPQIDRLIQDFYTFCSNLRIFVVEDHDESAVLYEKFRQKYGNDVFPKIFSCYTDLINYRESMRPDFLLLDYHTPEPEGTNYEGFTDKIQRVRKRFPTPIAAITGLPEVEDFRPYAELVFYKPVTPHTILYNIGIKLLKLRQRSENKRGNIIITGPTGSGKSEGGEALYLGSTDVTHPRMIGRREPREGEIGPFSLISVSYDDFKALEQEELICFTHEFGSGFGTPAKSYAILRSASDVSRLSIAEDAKKEMMQSCTLERAIILGTTNIFTISGLNYRQIAQMLRHPLAVQMVTPLDDAISFLKHRGTEHRIPVHMQNVIEMYENLPDAYSSWPLVHFMNRHLGYIKNLKINSGESLEQKMQDFARMTLSHQKMYSRLDHPADSHEYSKALIDYLIASMTPMKSIEELYEYCKTHSTLTLNFSDNVLGKVFQSDSVAKRAMNSIDILQVMKVGKDGQYVIVLDKPDIPASGETLGIDPKIRFNELLTAITGYTYLIRCDRLDVPQEKFHPYATNLKPTDDSIDLGLTDLAMVYSNAFWIDPFAKEIHGMPNLTLIFGKRGCAFRPATPAEILKEYRALPDDKRVYAGVHTPLTEYLDAMTELSIYLKERIGDPMLEDGLRKEFEEKLNTNETKRKAFLEEKD